MNALDLFCGRGGWTKGLLAEGFSEVVGVDVVSKRQWHYPGVFLKRDITQLESRELGRLHFDVVIGSPPCKEFSVAERWAKHRRQNPEKGMELVKAFIRVKNELNPKYWLMENVKELTEYFRPPDLLIRFCDYGYPSVAERAFWGDFPEIPKDPVKPLKALAPAQLFRNPWLRAEIPLPVARAVAKAFLQKEEKQTRLGGFHS